MRRKPLKQMIFAIAALSAVLPVLASAEIPAEIPIQAYLTDDSGVPVDGTVTIGFSIYNAESGGARVHQQELTIDADAGAFTAYLNPDMEIFENDSELYIGVVVDGGEEMSPRIKLATVPYAAVAGNASNAATLQGQSAQDFAPSDYAPSWTDISDIPDQIGTTYTAGAGLDLAEDEFAVNFSAVQQRVTGSCGAGEAVVGINVDGSVMCQTTTASYTAGTSLELNGQEFSVSSGGISNAQVSDTAEISPDKIDGTAATLDSSPSFSGSVTASDFSYQNSRTRYLPLPASAFQPSNPTLWRLTGLSGHYGSRTETGNLYLVAPIQIPDGATLEQVNCYGFDNSAAEDLTLRVRVIRSNLWTSTDNSYDTIGESDLVTDGQSTSIQLVTVPGLGEGVDNNNNAYQISIWYQGAVTTLLRFYGCKARYTVDTPAP